MRREHLNHYTIKRDATGVATIRKRIEKQALFAENKQIMPFSLPGFAHWQQGELPRLPIRRKKGKYLEHNNRACPADTRVDYPVLVWERCKSPLPRCSRVHEARWNIMSRLAKHNYSTKVFYFDRTERAITQAHIL